MKVRITDIQRFCMHDGAGLRTTVFFAGCPLSCKWCHNIETQSIKNAVFYNENKCIGCEKCAVCKNSAHSFCGIHSFNRSECIGCTECADVCPAGALTAVYKEMTPKEIISEVERDIAFYGKTGGLTLSGGEPMAQPQAAIEILRLAKERGINTAIETSGYFDSKYIPELCSLADTFLWDFKDYNDARHLENTGVSNKKIIDNLRKVAANGAEIVLRCIILEGINFEMPHLDAIKALKSELGAAAELLPYHPMGESKARLLGLSSDFHNKKYIPSPEKLQKAREYIENV